MKTARIKEKLSPGNATVEVRMSELNNRKEFIVIGEDFLTLLGTHNKKYIRFLLAKDS
jgi:hypothetical protein